MAKLTEQQISDLWVKEGGDPRWAVPMAKIALRESGGNPKINNRGLNKNGTVDWGLFQVNDIWRKDPVVGPLFESGAILTPIGAAKAAIHILKVQGPKAWATYNPATDDKFLGAFKPGAAQPKVPHGASAATPGTPAVPGVPGTDNSGLRRQLISDFLQKGGVANSGAVLTLAGSYGQAKDIPGTPGTPAIPGTPATPAAPTTRQPGRFVPLGGSKNAGKGAFQVIGSNPGRLQPELVTFAKQVAGVYGGALTGLDGSTHSKMTTNGHVSEHWTGNATDVFTIGGLKYGDPGWQKQLIRAGRAALIAAGMPRAQALQAGIGLYNVGNHQIIFGINDPALGGDHTDHLHISTHAR